MLLEHEFGFSRAGSDGVHSYVLCTCKSRVSSRNYSLGGSKMWQVTW